LLGAAYGVFLLYKKRYLNPLIKTVFGFVDVVDVVVIVVTVVVDVAVAVFRIVSIF